MSSTIPDAPLAHLQHTLTPRLVGLVSIGGVIGAGLFVGSSAMIRQAGPLVLASYLFAGLLVVLLMRMLAEMSVERPNEGSFIAHIRRGLGDHAGFVAGWSYWVFWGTTAGSEIIASGALIRHLTGLSNGFGEAAVIFGTLIVNLVSARSFARVEALLSVTKVLAIVGFILIGLASAFGIFGGPGFHLGNLVDHGGFAPLGFTAGFAVLPILVQTLTGFEIATVAAAESTDAVRSVSHAAKSVVLRVVLFYLLSIFVILGIVPWNQVQVGVSPFAAALGRLALPGGDFIMTIVVLVAVVSCLNSALYVSSRVMLELAARREAPERFARLSARGVPINAVLATFVVEMVVAVCGALSPGRAYIIVLSFSGAMAMVDYLLAGCAQIRLRRAMQRRAETPVLPMWIFPALSYFTVVGIAAILIGMAILPATRLDFSLTFVALSLIAGAAMVQARRRRRIQ